MQWQPVSPQRYTLAEGPFWDSSTAALYFVDIAGMLACRLDTRGLAQWHLVEPVSAFIPTDQGDALVTLASGVYRLDLASPTDHPRLSLFSQPDRMPGNRANESRCDKRGRLWLGTMQNNIGPAGEDLPVERDSGSLFLLEGNKAMPVLEGLGIPNTLAWSDDGRYLYSADSKAGQLWRYALDVDGLPGTRETWAEPGPGVPDGSALDAEGYLWNARWGGGCLLRYDPEGRIEQRIALPVSHPTSCVFGGPDLRTLYVTSARPGQAAGPLDGAVLSSRLEVSGQPGHRFKG
ncbi:SMP-30/gluconolactonase/LRE family protein [Pseudomonas sp. DC3200b2]|uniref:SMP-30/gluconolactonase/LRE family protein n=1 Tax=Pseudomonas sp. DC3200b2 TaxID=2804669 RepID=UPI003CF16CE1